MSREALAEQVALLGTGCFGLMQGVPEAGATVAVSAAKLGALGRELWRRLGDRPRNAAHDAVLVALAGSRDFTDTHLARAAALLGSEARLLRLRPRDLRQAAQQGPEKFGRTLAEHLAAAIPFEPDDTAPKEAVLLALEAGLAASLREPDARAELTQALVVEVLRDLDVHLEVTERIDRTTQRIEVVVREGFADVTARFDALEVELAKRRANASTQSAAHDDAIARHDVELPEIKDEAADVRVIAERADRGVDELRAGAASTRQISTPHDEVLQVFADLVRQEKFATALALLEPRFGDDAPAQELPALVRARARSLMGTCLWALNQRERAAMLFVEAHELDGADEKVRSNAVVGLMVQERFDEAIDLALRLVRETPADGRLAANLIHARKAAGHEGDPLADISVEARATEDARVAHIEFLRSWGDLAWREHARSAVTRFPKSREAARLATEAALEEGIEVMRSHAPEPGAVTRAIAAGTKAAKVLHAQGQRLAETERVPAALSQSSVWGRSRRGSMSSGGRHDEALGRPAPHDQLVRLQRRAEEARLAADLAGPGDGLARAA